MIRLMSFFPWHRSDQSQVGSVITVPSPNWLITHVFCFVFHLGAPTSQGLAVDMCNTMFHRFCTTLHLEGAALFHSEIVNDRRKMGRKPKETMEETTVTQEPGTLTKTVIVIVYI